jgi:Ni,Fe-hydrogenase I cytochrome b subunit
MLCHCGDDGDTDVDAGLPPIAIALFFVLIMGVIMILANLNLVNQTLVLALFTCIALVIIFVRMTVFCGKSSHPRNKDIMGDYDDVRKRIFDAGI